MMLYAVSFLDSEWLKIQKILFGAKVREVWNSICMKLKWKNEYINHYKLSCAWRIDSFISSKYVSNASPRDFQNCKPMDWWCSIQILPTVMEIHPLFRTIFYHEFQLKVINTWHQMEPSRWGRLIPWRGFLFVCIVLIEVVVLLPLQNIVRWTSASHSINERTNYDLNKSINDNSKSWIIVM